MRASGEKDQIDISCSFLEIYKEVVRDLLNPGGTHPTNLPSKAPNITCSPKPPGLQRLAYTPHRLFIVAAPPGIAVCVSDPRKYRTPLPCSLLFAHAHRSKQ